MRVDGNSGGTPDYFPDSFDNVKTGENYKQASWQLDTNIADW